jgi:hypothetical protein
MPLVRPPYLGEPEQDSWMNQVTQIINTQLKPESNDIEILGGTTGLVGADGADAPHYAEVTLYSDPAVSSPPAAPTATFTWFTATLSGITAGWSQTPPTVDLTSSDTVYASKIAFSDTIAPFATTTETGSTPFALYDLTGLTSGYLPLTGGTMTGAIDGVTTLTADVIQLTGGTGTQGQLTWNTDEETLDLVNNGAVLQLGQEMHVHVKNQTGVTIAEGVPVMANGTLGASGRILITPMVGSVQANAKYLIGITTEVISNGTDGKVTQFGKVRHIDTTGTPYGETWADGDVLWIDPVTTGGLTNVEPSSTSLMAQSVAFVVHAHANVGELMVRASGQDEHEPLIHAVLKTGSTMTGTLGVPTVDFGDWTVTESGGSLYFATLGVNKMKLTAAGDLEITGTLTQSATIT